MKLLLITLFIFGLACESFAMKGAVALTRTVGAPAALDTSSTNVTSAAWVEFVASTPFACSGILVHNSGSQPLRVGIGASSAEQNLGLVIPIGTSVLVPAEIPKGRRLSLRSMGGTQSSGIVTLSCFQ